MPFVSVYVFSLFQCCLYNGAVNMNKQNIYFSSFLLPHIHPHALSIFPPGVTFSLQNSLWERRNVVMCDIRFQVESDYNKKSWLGTPVREDIFQVGHSWFMSAYLWLSIKMISWLNFIGHWDEILCSITVKWTMALTHSIKPSGMCVFSQNAWKLCYRPNASSDRKPMCL
jgi:hypothetical protein